MRAISQIIVIILVATLLNSMLWKSQNLRVGSDADFLSLEQRTLLPESVKCK